MKIALTIALTRSGPVFLGSSFRDLSHFAAFAHVLGGYEKRTEALSVLRLVGEIVCARAADIPVGPTIAARVPARAGIVAVALHISVKPLNQLLGKLFIGINPVSSMSGDSRNELPRILQRPLLLH